MLVYIWFRFEWQFAHRRDRSRCCTTSCATTIGILQRSFQIQFDLAIVAAILLIVGYSMNDTVVVFDRVRENLRKYKTMPLLELLNQSVNETLARTVITSMTTLLALLALIIFGGAVIRDFSFAMIWGVIVGTYSSVFIAGALLLYVQPQRGGQKKAVGQAERLAAVDEDERPAALGAEPAAALPEPDAAPDDDRAAIVRAAQAAEAAMAEQDDDDPEPAGSRRQRRASSSRERRKRRRKRGKN